MAGLTFVVGYRAGTWPMSGLALPHPAVREHVAASPGGANFRGRVGLAAKRAGPRLRPQA